jgi:SPP1 family predicted phage head-tail adaptor
MKSGQLRHFITLERMVSGLDDFGGATEDWAEVARLRAALGPMEQVENQAADGAQDLVRIVFITRVFDGVKLADRVIWRGLPYAIKAIGGGDFAHGDGLRLTCEGRL